MIRAAVCLALLLVVLAPVTARAEGVFKLRPIPPFTELNFFNEEFRDLFPDGGVGVALEFGGWYGVEIIGQAMSEKDATALEIGVRAGGVLPIVDERSAHSGKGHVFQVDTMLGYEFIRRSVQVPNEAERRETAHVIEVVVAPQYTYFFTETVGLNLRQITGFGFAVAGEADEGLEQTKRRIRIGLEIGLAIKLW